MNNTKEVNERILKITEELKMIMLKTTELESQEKTQQKERIKKLEKQLQPQPQPCQLLTLYEVCDILRVKRWTIYKLVESGKLKGYKMGKEYRFKKEDVDAYFESNLIKY